MKNSTLKSIKAITIAGVIIFVIFLILSQISSFFAALQVGHSKTNSIIIACIPAFGPLFLTFQCLLSSISTTVWGLPLILLAPCMISGFTVARQRDKRAHILNEQALDGEAVQNEENFEEIEQKAIQNSTDTEDFSNDSVENDSFEADEIDNLIDKYSSKS